MWNSDLDCLSFAEPHKDFTPQKVYSCPSAHVTASIEKNSYQTSKGTVSSIQWNPSKQIIYDRCIHVCVVQVSAFDVTSAMSLGLRFCMSRTGGTGGGGQVVTLACNSMAASGL